MRSTLRRGASHSTQCTLHAAARVHKTHIANKAPRTDAPTRIGTKLKRRAVRAATTLPAEAGAPRVLRNDRRARACSIVSAWRTQ